MAATIRPKSRVEGDSSFTPASATPNGTTTMAAHSKPRDTA